MGRAARYSGLPLVSYPFQMAWHGLLVWLWKESAYCHGITIPKLFRYCKHNFEKSFCPVLYDSQAAGRPTVAILGPRVGGAAPQAGWSGGKPRAKSAPLVRYHQTRARCATATQQGVCTAFWRGVHVFCAREASGVSVAGKLPESGAVLRWPNFAALGHWRGVRGRDRGKGAAPQLHASESGKWTRSGTDNFFRGDNLGRFPAC